MNQQAKNGANHDAAQEVWSRYWIRLIYEALIIITSLISQG
jgi:hypothetical protein